MKYTIKISTLLAPFLTLSLGCSTQTVQSRSPASSSAFPSTHYPLSETSDVTCSIEKMSPGKKSRLKKCNAYGKDFYLLEQTGTFAENAEDQGYLLAEEIEKGTIIEMVNSIDGIYKKQNGENKQLLKHLVDCYLEDITVSLSDEFNQASLALGKGYEKGIREKGKIPTYTPHDFVRANAGIELGNIIYGIFYTLDSNPVKAAASVAQRCFKRVIEGVSKDTLHSLFKNHLEKSSDNHKFGCTGIISPGTLPQNHQLFHGRNFDQSSQMETWNNYPVYTLMAEPGYYQFVGAGTAGLIFPGGISGFNERGISVSLHQMDTTRISVQPKAGSADVIPFVQQKILREAANIDEAIAVIKKTKSLSAWTILVSDAKTNEAASIEISTRGVVVARRTKDQPLVQTNHFINQKLMSDHFHERYNNWLETNSRMQMMNQEFAKKTNSPHDAQWAIDALSSHDDALEPHRVYGRGPVKAGNILSTIAIPGSNEFWVTFGEKLPGVHGHFAGLKVDFDSHSLRPFATAKTKRFKDQPNVEASFEAYVMAYRKFRAHDNVTSAQYLDQAIALTEKDHFYDVSLHYNRARIRYDLGRYQESFDELKEVLAQDRLYSFTRALSSMYLVAAAHAVESKTGTTLLSAKESQSYLDFAETEFKRIKELKEPAFPDIRTKMKVLKRIRSKKPDPELQSLNFGLSD